MSNLVASPAPDNSDDRPGTLSRRQMLLASLAIPAVGVGTIPIPPAFPVTTEPADNSESLAESAIWEATAISEGTERGPIECEVHPHPTAEWNVSASVKALMAKPGYGAFKVDARKPLGPQVSQWIDVVARSLNNSLREVGVLDYSVVIRDRRSPKYRKIQFTGRSALAAIAFADSFNENAFNSDSPYRAEVRHHGRKCDINELHSELNDAMPKPRQLAGKTFTLLLVEEIEPGKAEIYPADYSTDDYELAKGWAETFNDREIDCPCGVWAVISTTATPVQPVRFAISA